MSMTVLIADESITIRSVAESLLRGESFSVHSAADGQMALEIATAERPDLALIGEKLAGVSGAEVCKTLKSNPELKSIPIIFMRADRPGPVLEQADAVLTKPFSPQSLLDAVHRFLVVDSAREGTAPVHLHEMAEPGLEEELIDQALGLDDVGHAPGEVREIGAGRAPSGVEPGGRDEEEMAPPLGLVDDMMAGRPADEEEDRVGKALDESFGLLAVPPEHAEPEPEPESLADAERLEIEATGQREPEMDLDLAIDAAFGEAPPQARPARADRAAADSVARSSLQELSLGEQGPGTTPAALTPGSSAAPDAGIDLGGMEELQDDRPHDYDWFIKEMQTDRSAAKEPAAPPEPPRIEPVVPHPASASSVPPKAPAQGAVQTPGGADPSVPRPPSRQAYDEFITEFRAEIARIEGMAAPADALMPEETERSRHMQSGKIAFEQTGEKSPPAPPAPPATIEASVRAWGDELIDSVTAQVARELAAKIDSKVIYSLIEQKLKEAQKHQG
jgi:CheY-like chemotaxis protein